MHWDLLWLRKKGTLSTFSHLSPSHLNRLITFSRMSPSPSRFLVKCRNAGMMSKGLISAKSILPMPCDVISQVCLALRTVHNLRCECEPLKREFGRSAVEFRLSLRWMKPVIVGGGCLEIKLLFITVRYTGNVPRAFLPWRRLMLAKRGQRRRKKREEEEEEEEETAKATSLYERWLL